MNILSVLPASLLADLDHAMYWHGTKAEVPLRKLPVPRNAKCPCGSGHKYKKCCMRETEAKQ
jgi:uncharacterized protein YecA (UPF0149 family)